VGGVKTKAVFSVGSSSSISIACFFIRLWTTPNMRFPGSSFGPPTFELAAMSEIASGETNNEDVECEPGDPSAAERKESLR
jgi:hypothetical protein